MKQDVKFRRNVYVILASILLLAVLIQVARSQFVLQSTHNEQWMSERDRLLSRMNDDKSDVVDEEVLHACIAYSENQAASIEIKDNVVQTLHYMKHPIMPIDVGTERVNLQDCSQVLIAFGNLSQEFSVGELENYVSNGGSVFFLHWLEPDETFVQLYRKLGILTFEYANLTKGIHMTSNVLIGEKGLTLDEDIISNTAVNVQLDQDTILLAESLEKVPLLWKRAYGKGNFMVFNGDYLNYKSSRGLIAGAVSLMEPDYMYPIFNAKVFYIDDFPAPVSNELVLSIYRKYGLDMNGFYREIWWPNMLQVAKKYQLKYTAAVIQSYNDRVDPPFYDPVDAEKHNLIAYGREILKSGGEISLHGYNHQSLQMDKEIADSFGYNAWGDQESMALSIREALAFIEKAFPNYALMSYVPPSNVLGVAGREALKSAWPELAIIASLYDTDHSQRSYVQEFGISEDGIIELPRVTSGYMEVPYTRWLEANAMTSVGVFSHFIHPDDLLSAERGGNLSWDKLYEDFGHMIERLRKTYPWLRDLTSTEAGLAVAGTVLADVKWDRSEDRIEGTIDGFAGEMYFVLRTERRISMHKNCTMQKMDEHTYLVSANKSRFVIGLDG